MLKEFLEDKETVGLVKECRHCRIQRKEYPKAHLITPEIRRRYQLGVYDFHLSNQDYFPAIEKVHRMLGYLSDFPESEVPKGQRSVDWFEQIYHVLRAFDDSDSLPYRKILQSHYQHRVFMPNLMIDKEILLWEKGQPLNTPPLKFKYYLNEEVTKILPKRKNRI